MRGLPAMLAVSLRRVWAEPGLALTVLALVLVTALLGAMLPRLEHRLADDAIRHDVRTASSTLRSVQVLATSRIVTADQAPDPMITLRDAGAELQSQLGPTLRDLLSAPTFTAESTRFELLRDPGIVPPPAPSFMALRVQEGAEEHVTYVQGRAPAGSSERALLPFAGEGGATLRLPVIEVGVSVETAARLRLELGQLRFGTGNPDDALLAPANVVTPPWIAFRAVGFFAVDEPEGEFWLGDRQLLRVLETGTLDNPIFLASGLISDEGYRSLLEAPGLLRYAWRFFLEAERIDAAVVEPLSDDLRRLRADFSSSSAPPPGQQSVRTGLPRIIDTFVARRAAASGALSVVGIGVSGVALAALILVAALVGERRRPGIAMTRGRGGSAWQALAGTMAESLLLTMPAALGGLALALLLVPARDAPESRLLALGIGLVAAGALVLTSLSAALGRLALAAHQRLAAHRPSARRLVAEGLVVALAVIGIVLLRRRGLAPGEVDPFLAAIPALLGVAVGLVVLRLYPLPVRLLGWLAAAGRGLVAPLALRRVARQPQVTQLLLLAALLAVSVGVFSSGVAQSVEQGQVRTAWLETGADYRVEAPTGGHLGAALDLESVPGVEALSPAAVADGTPVLVNTGIVGSTALVGIDAASYEEVTAGTPAAMRFPFEFGTDAPAEAGSPESPIPAVVSSVPLGGRVNLRVGNEFGLLLEGGRVTFRVVGLADAHPAVGPDQTFVLVALPHWQATRPQRPVEVTAIFVRGPRASPDDMTREVGTNSPGALLVSRVGRLATLREGPLVQAVTAGFRAGIGLTGAYLLLAVVAAIALSSERRSRDLAYLRTMGLSSRQALGLALLEFVPPVLVAVGGGALLGAAVMVVVGPTLGLEAFSGGAALSPGVDWTLVALLCGALLAVMTVAIGVAHLVGSGRDVNQALRVGAE